MRAIRKIVVAPTAFKGSLTPVEAALAMERGVRRILPDAQIIALPLADGGDGMLQCLAHAGLCTLHHHTVTDSLRRPHEAPYGISADGKTGFMEMAQICGLAQLYPKERDPRFTTTFGVGEMIAHLLAQGIGKLVIGLGGSSTNDGGSGALTALGWRLLDKQGEPIPLGNAGLLLLHRVIPSPLCSEHLEVVLAADVRNPLLGKNGATTVFAPQKGATPSMLPELERAMRRWAVAVHRVTSRKTSRIPGAGAAGGLAFGLLAHFPQARLVSGAEFVMQAVGFYDALRDADLVLTGEGQVDATTLHGKLLLRVLQAAKRQGVPVAVICGDMRGDPAMLQPYGVLGWQTLVSETISRKEAFREAAALLEKKTAKLLRSL
ncbi:MAG: glycerate kinase [Armatimonadota bacterium]|nr:glycerate kinase [bacterium]MDW8319774.1 glycerate kinase [Armatimonadota bacterium]